MLREWENKGMNQREFAAASELSKQGWQVQKNGWPDLLCYTRDGQLKAVEVKSADKKFSPDKPTECQDNALYRLGKIITTEVHYVNSDGEVERIENYSSPSSSSQRAKMRVFDGLGVS
jgi:hypothetical protein